MVTALPHRTLLPLVNSSFVRPTRDEVRFVFELLRQLLDEQDLIQIMKVFHVGKDALYSLMNEGRFNYPLWCLLIFLVSGQWIHTGSVPWVSLDCRNKMPSQPVLKKEKSPSVSIDFFWAQNNPPRANDVRLLFEMIQERHKCVFNAVMATQIMGKKDRPLWLKNVRLGSQKKAHPKMIDWIFLLALAGVDHHMPIFHSPLLIKLGRHQKGRSLLPVGTPKSIRVALLSDN